MLTTSSILSQEPRHQITLLCFLGTLVAYVERVGFSIAFTEMAKEAGTSEAVKGAVLSAFYWGYGLSQVCCKATWPHCSPYGLLNYWLVEQSPGSMGMGALGAASSTPHNHPSVPLLQGPEVCVLGSCSH